MVIANWACDKLEGIINSSKVGYTRRYANTTWVTRMINKLGILSMEITDHGIYSRPKEKNITDCHAIHIPIWLESVPDDLHYSLHVCPQSLEGQGPILLDQ